MAIWLGKQYLGHGVQTRADGLGVAGGAAIEFREAIGFELRIQRLEAPSARRRRQKAAAPIFDEPPALAFVVRLVLSANR